MTAAEPTQKKTKYFLLENYYLRHSTQLERIQEFMKNGLLPAATKCLKGPKFFSEALVAAHMPQFLVLLGFESLTELGAIRTRLNQDETFRKAFAAWESGPEPPYEHFSQTVLKAAEYCPEVELSASRPKAPRVFELRTYHSPTWRQLAALHERFAGPEIKIFHRVGVRPIIYSETLFGPNMPNLTYLTPFESLAAREKAWEAFAADPEWLRARKESIDTHGQIASVIQITLLKAAPYSPVS